MFILASPPITLEPSANVLRYQFDLGKPLGGEFFLGHPWQAWVQQPLTDTTCRIIVRTASVMQVHVFIANKWSRLTEFPGWWARAPIGLTYQQAEMLNVKKVFDSVPVTFFYQQGRCDLHHIPQGVPEHVLTLDMLDLGYTGCLSLSEPARDLLDQWASDMPGRAPNEDILVDLWPCAFRPQYAEREFCRSLKLSDFSDPDSRLPIVRWCYYSVVGGGGLIPLCSDGLTRLFGTVPEVLTVRVRLVPRLD